MKHRFTIVALLFIMALGSAFALVPALFSSASTSVGTIGTSTTSSALCTDYQVKTGYAASNYWAFYADGTNLVYTESPTGSTGTWSATTTIATEGGGAGCDLSTYFAGNTVYYVRTDASSSFFWLNVGTASASGISFGSETKVGTLGASEYPTVTLDSLGNAWISVQEGSTWGIYRCTATLVCSESLSGIAAYQGMIIPLNSGKVAFLYTTGVTSALNIITYNGVSWSSPFITTNNLYIMQESSAVAIGDNVYVASTDNNANINFIAFNADTGIWGTQNVLAAGSYAAISTDGASALAVLFGWTSLSSTNYETISTNLGGLWSAPTAFSSSESGGNYIVAPYTIPNEQPYAIWNGYTTGNILRIGIGSSTGVSTTSSSSSSSAGGSGSTTTVTVTVPTTTTSTVTSTTSVGTVTQTSTTTKTTTTTSVSTTTTTTTSTSTIAKTTVTSTATTTSPVTTTKTATVTSTVTTTSLTTATIEVAQLPSSTYLTCDQSSLNQGQNMNCHAYTTLYDGGVPGGSITFSVSPSSGGTFQNENCQVSSQQNAFFELSCNVQFNFSPSSSSGPYVITALYSGDLYHTASAATFSIVVNPTCNGNGQGNNNNCNGNGNGGDDQPHVVAGNAVGMLMAAMSLLTISSSNLGGALAVSVIGMTVGLPLVMQRSKLKTFLAHRTH